jgi:hypothetical protein
MSAGRGGTFQVQATTTRPKIIVTVDGVGVVSHAGSRLLANCATTISEIAVLADQAAFGVIRVGGVGLDMLAAARPTRRHRAGCDRGGAGGVPVGRALPAFRSCSARGTLCREAGTLRRSNAGANTAADHIQVLDQALAQIPDAHPHG